MVILSVVILHDACLRTASFECRPFHIIWIRHFAFCVYFFSSLIYSFEHTTVNVWRKFRGAKNSGHIAPCGAVLSSHCKQSTNLACKTLAYYSRLEKCVLYKHATSHCMAWLSRNFALCQMWLMESIVFSDLLETCDPAFSLVYMSITLLLIK